ncbi:MAG TPA: recombinase XerD, partial [Hyphomicrobiales bacterium]|nr:recombinase XerD [Hyphomicrobiales bacterium]
MKTIRVSLRTSDPGETKVRQAAAAAYMETVWRALRAERPASLDHRQATALAGELYRAWANGAARERTLSIVHTPAGWVRDDEAMPGEEEAAFAATLRHLDGLRASGEVDDLEPTLGPLVDRLLLGRGIAAVDTPSRRLLLEAFWLALKEGMEARRRNAEGDYSPDPKAQRFPEWAVTPSSKPIAALPVKVSLKGLVEDWWREAQAIGRKPSTHESYANTVAAFVA